MSCSWLFAGSHNCVPASQHLFHFPNCNCYTGWICRSRTVHWSGQGLWRVRMHSIMSWVALHYPCEKRLVVRFKLLRYEQGFILPRTHGAWGAWRTHVHASGCFITGCSHRPNHPHISGPWIAQAWWPIVVSANQENTSSRMQYSFSFSFASDEMQLCIKKSF